jgi:predicted small lipoprotein YifL
MTRRSLLIAVLAALALPLAACGIKGPPEPPPDTDPKAPRRYPTR